MLPLNHSDGEIGESRKMKKGVGEMIRGKRENPENSDLIHHKYHSADTKKN